MNIPQHLQKEWYLKHLAWLGYDVDAKPERAKLRYADLRWADLREADLFRADLRWADLRGADLRWANLRWADLRYANLCEADLRGANLRWADLRGANIDFSCWPLWCGSFDVVTDYQQKSQLAYHWLRMAESEDEELTKNQREKLAAARTALVPLASDWDGFERHRLSRIE
jgi:hypothetical protein